VPKTASFPSTLLGLHALRLAVVVLRHAPEQSRVNQQRAAKPAPARVVFSTRAGATERAVKAKAFTKLPRVNA